MDTPQDDPIRDAERQMIEHEVDLYREFLFKLLARIGPLDFDHSWTDEEQREIQAVWREIVEEDPEAHEIGERLGLLQRFHIGE
jgi:hypothetical protein